ncbi:MAG: class I SAM-dependent methyltransferase family protein [Nanoarchaeota archaeon]|nr:class I SAM-dependent methyltransferase family protein [Nanoarchaeota archaeon]
MKAVKVEKSKAQPVIEMLRAKGLFDYSRQINFGKDFFVIPVLSSKGLKGLELVEARLKKRIRKARTLFEALKDKMNAKELEALPRAFDTIGDIAIVDIPAELVKKEALIGKALLELNRHIKVVAKKVGVHTGVYRTQKLKVIAGEKRKETVCKENNILLKLDVEKCYFSPRLSTERKRVADLVKKGEAVLVMFSGVAPYNCVIAKNTLAKSVYGIEINPSAHKYGLENVKLNKLNNVHLYCGDVRKVVPSLGMKFDRIIMPLPKSASEFLDVAALAAKDKVVVHFYEILDIRDFPGKCVAEIKKHFPRAKLLNAVKAGDYAPGMIRGCVDFMV